MKLIELKALKKFKCIGGDCPQLCCQSFKITVDSKAMNIWAGLEDISGEGTLDKHIMEVEEHGVSLYHLKLNSQGKCELLGGDGWCTAHKKYGHESLPEICQTYPRGGFNSHLAEVKTATFSCPVIVNTVLFEKNELDFNYELDKLFKIERPIMATKNDKISILLSKFVTAVFKLNKVPINLKLFYIAQCVGVMNEQILQNGFNEELIKQLLAKPKDVLFNIGRDIKTKKIKVDPVTAGSYWKNIAQLFFDRNVKLDSVDLINSPLMQLCSQDMAQYESVEGAGWEHYREIYARILEYKEHWQNNKLEHFSSLLERYIITSFVNKGFPLHPQDEQFSATLVFIMTVASSIQLALWIAYKESDGAGPTDEQLQQIFYHVESTVGHTDTIYRKLASDPHMVQINRYAQVFLDLFV